MCICKDIYIYIHICVYLYLHMYVYVFLNIYIYIHMYVCIYICLYIYICVIYTGEEWVQKSAHNPLLCRGLHSKFNQYYCT